MGFETSDDRGKRRREIGPLVGQLFQGTKLHLVVCRISLDLDEEHAVVRAAGCHRKIFRRRGMMLEVHLQSRDCDCSVRADKCQPQPGAGLSHGEPVAGIKSQEGEQSGCRGRQVGGDDRHQWRLSKDDAPQWSNPRISAGGRTEDP